MRTIETGKYKGKKLVECPESYIIWSSQHRKNFGPGNRWISDDAKRLLEEKDMNFGFEIREEDGRKGIEYACYRNDRQCTTALGKPVSFKSQKSAQNWIDKQVEMRKADALISDVLRAAMKAEAEAKEAAEKAERDAAFDERLRRQREEKEAHEKKARLNSALRMAGYKWVNVGFKSEEDADAFDPNLPIGAAWCLFDPQGKAVSLSQAKAQIGW
jgi:hypothetical protein